MNMNALPAATAVALTALLVGCSDADVASRNLSQAADQFEIARRARALANKEPTND